MPHPTDIHVGSRVREFRIKRGLTQSQIGKMLGISFQQFQKYEKGTNRIGANRLWSLSKILHIEIPELFEGLPGLQSDQVICETRQIMMLAKELDKIENSDVLKQFLILARAHNKA